METADLVIVGGGIVGLATGYRFVNRHPGKRVVVLEKEPTLAKHQTGHNSGVIHSGIYYKPGSLKAENCRRGKRMMEDFCRDNGIAFDTCGKVIVATQDWEIPLLKNIYERGQANGVVCELIDKSRLAELEPHAAGIQAIHVPEAGIVNYMEVCHKYAELIQKAGGEVRTGIKVKRIQREGGRIQVAADQVEIAATAVINCAGLHSDRMTHLSGAKRPAKIVPFRGEYYELKPDARYLCKNLIYPVPDPNFPFLGVHFTRMINGDVECGPNAVLAFAREGYTWSQFNLRDFMETMTYGSFWRIAARYWRTGAGEIWRSWSKKAFVKALQRLVPEIQTHHLEAAPAGVRAQALAPGGNMVDDFLIEPFQGVVNVCNAPSPGATSSLSIGDHIVDVVDQQVR